MIIQETRCKLGKSKRVKKEKQSIYSLKARSNNLKWQKDKIKEFLKFPSGTRLMMKKLLSQEDNSPKRL